MSKIESASTGQDALQKIEELNRQLGVILDDKSIRNQDELQKAIADDQQLQDLQKKIQEALRTTDPSLVPKIPERLYYLLDDEYLKNVPNIFAKRTDPTLFLEAQEELRNLPPQKLTERLIAQHVLGAEPQNYTEHKDLAQTAAKFIEKLESYLYRGVAESLTKQSAKAGLKKGDKESKKLAEEIDALKRQMQPEVSNLIYDLSKSGMFAKAFEALAESDRLPQDVRKVVTAKRAEVRGQMASELKKASMAISEPALDELAEGLARDPEEAKKRASKKIESQLKELKEKKPKFPTNEQIKKILPPELHDVAFAYRDAQKHSYETSMRVCQEMLAILNSGLPIEMVIFLLMMLMGEKNEAKLKERMAEQSFMTGLNARAPKADISKLGWAAKSDDQMLQQVQAEMNSYKQFMESMGSILKIMQDLIATIIRNLR